MFCLYTIKGAAENFENYVEIVMRTAEQLNVNLNSIM